MLPAEKRDVNLVWRLSIGNNVKNKLDDQVRKSFLLSYKWTACENTPDTLFYEINVLNFFLNPHSRRNTSNLFQHQSCLAVKICHGQVKCNERRLREKRPMPTGGQRDERRWWTVVTGHARFSTYFTRKTSRILIFIHVYGLCFSYIFILLLLSLLSWPGNLMHLIVIRAELNIVVYNTMGRILHSHHHGNHFILCHNCRANT